MALALVRLRLALQAGARRRAFGVVSPAVVVLAWVAAGILGVAMGTGLGFLAGSGSSFGEFFVLVEFSAVFVVWVIAPVVIPGLGGALVEPARLEQFPLTRVEQVGGLLLGALVTPPALLTLLATLGPAIALDIGPASRVVAVVAALLITVASVGTSSAVQAGLAGSLATPRGRAVALVVVAALVLGTFLLARALQGMLERIGATDTGPINYLLSWTPPGAAAWSSVALESGDVAGALARLGIVALTVVGAMLLWGYGLLRHLRGGGSAPTAARRRGPRGRIPSLVPVVLKPLGSGPGAAALAQHVRYYVFRAPRAVQYLAITPVVGVLVAHGVITGSGLALGAAFFAVLLTSGAAVNVFGFDGRGVEYDAVGGGPFRPILAGKMLAPLVFVLPLLVALVLVEAGLQDAWTQVPAALLAGATAVAISLAACAWGSVLNPFDQDRAPASRFRTIGGVMLTLAVVYGLVLLGSAAWAAAIAATGVPSWMPGLVFLPLAVAVAAASVAGAGTLLERRPELVLERLAGR